MAGDGVGRPRRKRSDVRVRGVVATAVVVLVVGAGLAVTDVALRAAAEQRLAEPAGATLGAPSQVTIGGGPFLLQLARGRLDDVRVTADQAVLDEGTVTDVRLAATGVTTGEPYTAESATVSGTVPTALIRDRIAARGLDVDVAVADGGLRASGEVMGAPWGVTLVPRVADGGRLVVDLTAADVGGLEVPVELLPASVREAVSGMEVPVSGLPNGLALRDAAVVEGGVAITATGEDVVLP